MSKGEMRRLVLELAAQLPDDASDALNTVDWLKRVVSDHWDEDRRVLRLAVSGPDAG